MGKNDFDFNFDATNDDDFDPKAFLGSEDFDEKMDLSGLTDEDFDLTSAEEDFPLDDADGEFDPNQDYDFGDDMGDFLREEEDAEEQSSESFEEEPAEEPEYSESGEEPEYSEAGEESPEEEEEEHSSRRQRQRRETSFKINLPKIAMPNIFAKFYDLYFAPIGNKELRELPPDPNNPTRRRRKKSRTQIFKEVYLPPIIVCVCMVLVLSFVIGSISNLIERRRTEAQRQESQLDASISQAQLEQQRIDQLIQTAENYVTVYDYPAAIDTLRSVGDLNAHSDIAAKVSEYIQIQDQLEEHKDPSLIPNLSFNLLIEDLARAKADKELGGLYNKNFVTTGEFQKILQTLYSNGFVLVDFDSFTSSSIDASGAQIFMDKPILLPAGKKPIMITETLTNYFNYMIDGNGDNVADAQGDGFASRLVVVNGEIKAEYVDSSGQTLVGDYDLVPILETFIKEHPDFSYRGARAIIGVTGYEGIFGYRITNDYVGTKGQDFVNQEIAGAKEVVAALREKGYTLACNTFKNLPYGQKSVTEITADLQAWTNQITPVLGPVDVMVFVKDSPISNYSDAAFQALYTTGFRYFVEEGNSTYAEINTTYVRQKRLIVSGNTMAWKTSNFTTPNIFDPAVILDISTRGQVPNG